MRRMRGLIAGAVICTVGCTAGVAELSKPPAAPVPMGRMSMRAAREVVRAALVGQGECGNHTAVRIHATSIDVDYAWPVGNRTGTIRLLLSSQADAGTTKVLVVPSRKIAQSQLLYCGDSTFQIYLPPDSHARVVDAWNELVARAQSLTDPAVERDFEAKAAAWRAASPKPALSEEGHRNQVIAEAAFREKDVDSAIDHYEEALQTDPTWPTGTFNLALLYGESGDFAAAARYMKRYLVLVPDGPDAKAARDKVIVWEDKASRPTP